ncbi:hypothetical protein PVK06_030898 [Gossypium arboreum]|uniref:Uncharacterized protein n=1 Tax=Gossypium arboreum TaxID=29729 RepID=A0ABR0NPJ0_GOSAR|nr:hypothetical protein PVK06_030898 [Gossypium arboreum]
MKVSAGGCDMTKSLSIIGELGDSRYAEPHLYYTATIAPPKSPSVSTTMLAFELNGRLKGSSTYTGQPIDYSGEHMDFKKTNNLFLSIGAGEGTSNTVFKDDNEGADEEEDVNEEKGTQTQMRGRSQNLSQSGNAVQMFRSDTIF